MQKFKKKIVRNLKGFGFGQAVLCTLNHSGNIFQSSFYSLVVQPIAGSHSGSLLSGFTKNSFNSTVVFGFHFLENFMVS